MNQTGKTNIAQDYSPVPSGFTGSAQKPECQHDYELIETRETKSIENGSTVEREAVFYCRKCLDIQSKSLMDPTVREIPTDPHPMCDRKCSDSRATNGDKGTLCKSYGMPWCRYSR